MSMRMSKSSLGKRKKVYSSQELLEPKKYFLTYEGEVTESQYFNGISRVKDKLKIKPSIQLISLERNHLYRRWSHPTKIFEIVKPFMDNLKNNQLCVTDLIESIVQYCFEYSKDINNKKDCDNLRVYVKNILDKEFNLVNDNIFNI